MTRRRRARAGEVGYVATGLKDIGDMQVGDTITDAAQRPAAEPLPGYQRAKPMVFAGLLPGRHRRLPAAARRARASSSSTTPRSSTSPRARRRWASASAAASSACCTWRSSGSGWSASTTSTCSSPRRAWSTTSTRTNGEVIERRQPRRAARRRRRSSASRSRASRRSIIVPSGYVGDVMELCHERRGEFEEAWSTSPSSACMLDVRAAAGRVIVSTSTTS